MLRPRCFLLLAAAMAASGCAGHDPPDGGFASVQSLSRERIGADVEWNRAGQESKDVDEKVEQLLARPLSAESAVQIALLNNRGLQATFEDLGIAQADLVQAGLLKNPVLDLSVLIPDRPPGHTYLDFIAAENLLDVFLIPARKKLAAAEVAEAQAKVADEVFDLAERTASAFYECQGSQQIVALRQSAVAAATAASDSAERLHQAGNIAELVYLNARAQADRTKIELTDSESTNTDARIQLETLMGIAGANVDWTIVDSLPAPPAAGWATVDLQRMALHRRQDLLAARGELVVAARVFGITDTQRFFDDADSFSIGPEAERETDGQWRIGPTLSIPLPLFDQGQAKLARAAAIFHQSQEKYVHLAVDICGQVKMSANHLERSRTEAQLYHDEILPTQQRLLNETLRQYNGMFANVFDLLASKRDQIDTSVRYVSVMQNYWIAHTKLERAVGGSFTLPAETIAPTSQSALGERP